MPPRENPSPERRNLLLRALPWIAMFAVALALRAGYAALMSGPGTVPYSDPAHYDEIARNLARGAGYSLGEGEATRATAYRPPLVPWITSLVYGVAGHRYDLAVQVQALFGALVPLLVVLFGAALFGAGVGWTAGWLAAIHPLQVFMSGHLLTENAFTALILAGFVLGAKWAAAPRPALALATGVCFGLASLARPLAQLLPILVLLWAWPALGAAVGSRRRLAHAGLLALGLVFAVGPWTLRNALAFGAFVPVSTNGGRVLLEGYNPRSWDDPALRGGGALDVHAEPYATLIGLPEIEADRQSRAEALRFVRERLRELPAIALAKLGRFWRMHAEGGGTGTWQRTGSPLGRLLERVDPVLIWSLFIFPLAAWGAVHTLRGPERRRRSLPLIVVAYFSLLAMVFFGGLRMRAPIEPMIVLMAAVGIADLRARLARRRVAEA